MNITTRTTIVSNIQLDDNIGVWLLWFCSNILRFTGC